MVVGVVVLVVQAAMAVVLVNVGLIMIMFRNERAACKGSTFQEY